jgi:hypothetical protein
MERRVCYTRRHRRRFFWRVVFVLGFPVLFVFQLAGCFDVINLVSAFSPDCVTDSQIKQSYMLACMHHSGWLGFMCSNLFVFAWVFVWIKLGTYLCSGGICTHLCWFMYTSSCFNESLTFSWKEKIKVPHRTLKENDMEKERYSCRSFWFAKLLLWVVARTGTPRPKGHNWATCHCSGPITYYIINYNL